MSTFYGYYTLEPEINTMNDRDAAIVQIELGDIRVSASARREPGDKPDDEIGTLLALSRAYNHLAFQLSKRASAKINHAAEIKRHRDERKLQELSEQADSQKSEVPWDKVKADAGLTATEGDFGPVEAPPTWSDVISQLKEAFDATGWSSL